MQQRGNRSFGGRNWQCNRANFRDGNGAGRGRNMTAPAWMQPQNGFGNFDQNSGGAGAPPHVLTVECRLNMGIVAAYWGFRQVANTPKVHFQPKFNNTK